MPLLAPEPPSQAAEIVHSTFRTFAENGTFRTPALRNATGPLQLTQPHQAFTLGLADLVAGKGLEAATPTGWRYLVQQGDKTLASAETALTGTAPEHVFAAINEGRFVASTADAIRTARALPEVSKGNFELRLLRVPGLYFTAVWLHGAQGTSDVLVPLDEMAGKPVPAAQLLKDLASKAHAAAAVGPADRSGG